MYRGRASSTRTDTPLPDTTRFLSAGCLADGERISDWRSRRTVLRRNHQRRSAEDRASDERAKAQEGQRNAGQAAPLRQFGRGLSVIIVIICRLSPLPSRSEEHTSELQSLMRISYAVFCLKKK